MPTKLSPLSAATREIAKAITDKLPRKEASQEQVAAVTAMRERSDRAVFLTTSEHLHVLEKSARRAAE